MSNVPQCPFVVGDQIAWSSDVPDSWQFIYTPGPMTVTDFYWNDGTPSEYSMKFGGIPFGPAWIVEVEFPIDTNPYYDYTLRAWLHGDVARKLINQRWLVKS